MSIPVRPAAPLPPSPAAPVSGTPLRRDARFTKPQHEISVDDPVGRPLLFALLAMLAAFIYAYWNTFSDLVEVAWDTDQYSHGWIVPLLALYIMYTMRPNQSDELDKREVFGIPLAKFCQMIAVPSALLGATHFFEVPGLQNQTWMGGLGLSGLFLSYLLYVFYGQPLVDASALERWIGVAICGAAIGIRVLAAMQDKGWMDHLSMVLAVFGLLVTFGGWELLKWTGPACGFLLFMFPLPAFIENSVMMKLRTFASIISEIILTIMGQDVMRDGNMLTIAGQQMSVADECSGLRMVTIFGAMGIAVALLIRRPWWDKVVVLLTTLPIALGVNILRIVVTCFLMGNFPGMSEYWKEKLYHDLPGYVMILVAMGLLLLLIKILEKLSVQEEAVNLRGAGFAGVR